MNDPPPCGGGFGRGSVENMENHRFTMKNLLGIFFHDHRSIFVGNKKEKRRERNKE